MTPIDAERFTATLAAVLDLYGKIATPETINLWFRALQKYPLDKISRALTAHVRNPDVGQYVPKPADVIRMIDGNSDDRAALAWAKVSAAMRSVGGWESVAFDEPAIHMTITGMGGWVRLTQTDEDELPFRKRDFERLYRAYCTTPAQYLPHLPGRAEIERSASGQLDRYPVVPRAVGDLPAVVACIAGGTHGATLIGGPVQDGAVAPLALELDRLEARGKA